MFLKLLILSLSLCQNALSKSPKLAIITVPVADLIANPHLNPKQNLTDFYQTIPLAPAGKESQACPRLHQALLHEQVQILAQNKQQVHVRILNAFFIDQATGKKTGDFWTLQKNMIPLAEIKKEIKNYKDYLPLPINYQQTSANYNLDAPNTITLLEPWFCPQTNLTYSAGTRFKIDPQDQQAYLYDAQTNHFIKSQIPKHFWRKNQALSAKKARQLFVKTVKKWARPNHGHQFIPYTWGGTSFVQKLPTREFQILSAPLGNYYAILPNNPQTQTGLDCTGLVLRAAQAACIPYFYKNSTTLAKELKTLAAQQAIEPGDLIWISGHVIIITNPKTGWCCEARDYGHGYGQTQQIHISKLFKDVQSLEQIKAAHLSGKPLTRINKNGESCRNYQVKILKLLA